VEYNCSLIKVYWLAACIALRVVGAVLVVFPRPGHKTCTIFLRHKIIGAPKNFKNVYVSYLGLELTIHVIKSQIHLGRMTVPLRDGEIYLDTDTNYSIFANKDAIFKHDNIHIKRTAGLKGMVKCVSIDWRRKLHKLLQVVAKSVFIQIRIPSANLFFVDLFFELDT
jgi:hypothetical protein